MASRAETISISKSLKWNKGSAKPKLWLWIARKNRSTNYRIIYPSSISFVGFFTVFHIVPMASFVRLLFLFVCTFLGFISKMSHHLNSFHSYSLRIFLLYFDRLLLFFSRILASLHCCHSSAFPAVDLLLLLFFPTPIHMQCAQWLCSACAQI